MFVISLVLFVTGMLLTGISFSLPLPALFFVLGILLVAGALALPFHVGNRT